MSTSTQEPLTSQHKRTASFATTASYGASSTESPAQNIDTPEPHVQELQNVFVCLIIKAIGGGGGGHADSLGTRNKNVAATGWIMPRIIPFDIPTDSRTDPTSFACLLPDNHTDQSSTIRHDRVVANSDGKTNKKGGGIGRLIWDKQKTAIAFEVMFHLPTDD
jgi:hypothetical protein